MLGEGVPAARHLREVASPTNTVTFPGSMVITGLSVYGLQQAILNDLNSSH